LYSTLYPKLKANISIIPTGVNFQNYNSKTKSCSFSDILPGTFNFAFVGRLAYPKQVKTIINAFNQAFFNRKSVHLWIAGSGRDDEQLKDYVITLECVENIHFTGQLSRENTEKLMKSADAGVLLSENEGSPIVVKEFLAYAKPVIVNNVGDITDYVKDGINGYIVDPKNLQSITNALHKIMLTNKRMSVAAIESVIPYEERNIYKKVIDVFQKLNEQH
jgi:glycosyltransferase involved in cell wall biosynthesis